ncbi:katanin p80 WD40 repeat-containing subunit B1 homolog isoform X2 [Carica papaya]|uniref:katanin p80 WD40 repeat-containing subunit B1 homolog isoform X2 n=1 Tax=Carica papaya TaxID=3649 RepID=UPI000B8CB39A|nr:katanin p80 WD40 repeat-containing subunit B1 homolog isoform X2 [Carica papaya]
MSAAERNMKDDKCIGPGNSQANSMSELPTSNQDESYPMQRYKANRDAGPTEGRMRSVAINWERRGRSSNYEGQRSPNYEGTVSNITLGNVSAVNVPPVAV